MPFDQIAVIALIGLLAGVLGGLAGIGGSVFIIPALHIVFSSTLFGEPKDPQIHHLYMAAAMTVNVTVSVPAAIQHYREGAVRTLLLRILIPATAAATIGGVMLSNLLSGEALRLLLALFLILYSIWNFSIIARPRRRSFTGTGRVERTPAHRLAACGAITGAIGGLLGLGGGLLLVPLLQLACNVRLKNAIATSSAVLCFTAAIGAALKLATLSQHGERIDHAFVYIVCMAPTAILGALWGAKLVHRLPIIAVRLVMTFIIFLAATKLIGS
ncbi:MAG: sulfite exporter TauE/SafE family protein [Phycisphaeraceae bacterium]|nr:sulfite exporter TauE/SafE family protein [Phycisphaeraceae bacterium]